MKNREFFKEVYQLVKPYWVSEEKKKAYLLLALVIVLNLGFIFIGVKLNYWSRDLYNALETKSQDELLKQIIYFFPIVAGLIFFFVSKNFSEAFLAFNWRQWMTKNYLKKWSDKETYYHVMNSKDHIDNPDQRISQDLNSLSGYTLGFFMTIIRETVNVITFGVILWGLSRMLTFTLFGWSVNIPGYLIWAALLYAAIGSGIMILVGYKLVRLDFMQERYEANFRFSLIRLQERREEVALYDGIFTEKKHLLNRFGDIRENFYKIIRRQIYVNTWNNLYINLATLFPILVSYPMYFAGIITLGNLMQIVGAFSQVKGSFSVIVDNFVALASWRASIIRLAEFNENIARANKEVDNKKIVVGKSPKNELRIQNLTITKPDGEVLKKNINVDLQPKDRLIIKGENGAGKSTIIRAMKNLWKYGEGKIVLPEKQNIMFIPQRPYLPMDSLLNVIYYPGHEPSEAAQEQIISHMKKFNLLHLIPFLQHHGDWTNILSLGEQQRIAVIRALINQPDIIILDEPTSSLDKKSEEVVFQELLSHFKDKMMICVSHSNKFEKFFNKVLDV